MKIIKLKKNFKDKRGYISDIFYKKNIKHVSFISSNKGSVRGNNYFKKNHQFILNLGGSFEYCYIKKNEKKLKKILIKKYQIIETPPYEVHAINFLKTNELIELSTLSLIQKLKSKDSVKCKII